MSLNQQVHRNELSQNDVLCGRGGCINAYPGNLQFRTICGKLKDAYRSSKTNGEKNRIVEGIVRTIRSMDPPGRFLKEDSSSDDCWVEIGDDKAKSKIVQIMRKDRPRLQKLLGSRRKSTAEVSVTSSTYSRQTDSEPKVEDIEGQPVVNAPNQTSSSMLPSYKTEPPYTIPMSIQTHNKANNKDTFCRRVSTCSSLGMRFSLTPSEQTPILHELLTKPSVSETKRRDSTSSLMSFPGSPDDIGPSSSDLDKTEEEKSLPLLTSPFKNLTQRQNHYHNTLKNEPSTLPPLMVVVLSNSKRETLMKSMRTESLMKESLLSLSRMSIDLDPIASEIISSTKVSSGDRSSSNLSREIIDALIEDLSTNDELGEEDVILNNHEEKQALFLGLQRMA